MKNKQPYPVRNSNQGNRAPKRYSQVDSKSADFNDNVFNGRPGQFNAWAPLGNKNLTGSRNFGDKGNEISYGRRMSGDSNMISIPQIPPNTFEMNKGQVPIKISDNMVLFLLRIQFIQFSRNKQTSMVEIIRDSLKRSKRKTFLV